MFAIEQNFPLRTNSISFPKLCLHVDFHMNESLSNEGSPLLKEPERALFEVGENDLAQAMGKNSGNFFQIFDDHLYVAIVGLDRRMVALSRKLRADFNLSTDLPWDLSDFIAPATEQANHVDDIWRTVSRYGTWRGDVRHRSKKGTTSWLNATIIACNDDAGAICRYIAIFTDVTTRVENEAALRVSRNDLRALASHMDFSQECDRKRIAREIHDELGQHLLALKMDLLGLQLPPSLARPRATRNSADLVRSVDETMQHVKRIINDLRPIALDVGLVEAVRMCAESFTRRHKVSCDLSLSDASIQLNEVAVTTLYRVLQESLVNIGRHAQATRVGIALVCSRNAISIEIDDDGVGMAPALRNRRKTFGLLGMKERVEMLGGTLTIISQIGTGTKVVASMPRK